MPGQRRTLRFQAHPNGQQEEPTKLALCFAIVEIDVHSRGSLGTWVRKSSSSSAS